MEWYLILEKGVRSLNKKSLGIAWDMNAFSSYSVAVITNDVAYLRAQHSPWLLLQLKTASSSAVNTFILF